MRPTYVLCDPLLSLLAPVLAGCCESLLDKAVPDFISAIRA
jgi:hypothetical protein